MFDLIRPKIRAVVQDNAKTDLQAYTASGRTFVIDTLNVVAVSSVSVNGTNLTSNDYTYTSATQEVTINSGKVEDNDAVVISFSYDKYSDTEIDNYIKSALCYLDINGYHPHFDVESGDEDIAPIPTPKQQNLIVMIAAILIKPNITSYRTATVSIVYPVKMDRDEKIAKLVAKAKRSSDGISGVIDLASNLSRRDL